VYVCCTVGNQTGFEQCSSEFKFVQQLIHCIPPIRKFNWIIISSSVYATCGWAHTHTHTYKQSPFYKGKTVRSPIPVAARFKARVYGRSLAGNAISNPAVGIVACLLRMLCVVRQRSLQRADHSSRGVLSSMVCLSVILKPQQWGGVGSTRNVKPWKLTLRLYMYLLKQHCDLSRRAGGSVPYILNL